MNKVWVIERFAPNDDHELTGFWVHKTHQGAVKSAIKMANEDKDRLYRSNYRDNGVHKMPRVDVYGNIITVYSVDGQAFIEYNIRQTELGE